MRVGGKIIIALIMFSLFISVFFTGCSSLAVEKINIEDSISFFGKGNEYRAMSAKENLQIVQGESIALFYDKKSGGISIYDRNGGKYWNSLPEKENSFASNLYVKVFCDGKLYHLDTAANSAANASPAYKILDNGVVVTYILKADNINIELPVQYTLTGTGVNVSIDMSSVKVSEGARIISVSVLPFMGALSYAEDYVLEQIGDYFLLPDGPGAIMHTALEDDSFKSAVFSVYGKEYHEECVSASIAAFGIKDLKNTLSVTVTKGDENAVIKVFRSTVENEFNRVYPEFIITPVSGESGEIKAGKSYNGIIEVCYSPASGENVNYITMAAAIRQSLMNSGFIGFDKVTEEYPFFVSVINSTDGTKSGTVTTFQQTENLLSFLKSKGVNNIELILEGAFSGGMRQKNNSSLKAVSAAGGSRDLNSLCEYAASQQINVFGGVNFSSSVSKNNVLKGLDSDNLSNVFTDSVISGKRPEDVELYYKNASVHSNMSENILKLTEKTGIDGICVFDTESSVFYTKEGFLHYTDSLNNSLASAGRDSLIMLDGCNMNIIKNADFLRNVSFETSFPESVAYKTVPFIPAVLHSSYIYTGAPVNTSSVTRLQLLKYIEYGAAPHYEWCFSSNSSKYYENDINDAVSFYIDGLARLGDISSKRIINHFEYESGVYCTEYEGGIKIYVNYNNYSVVLGSIAVMPYDFLRIG